MTKMDILPQHDIVVYCYFFVKSWLFFAGYNKMFDYIIFCCNYSDNYKRNYRTYYFFIVYFVLLENSICHYYKRWENTMRLKIIIILIIALLFLIIIVQNVQPVIFSLFHWEVTLPLIVMLFATFVLGIITGMVVGSISRHKNKKV